MSAAPRKTLLCVGNFGRETGYAWNTIRRVWAAVAQELATRGVRTLVVYREPPQPAAEDESPLEIIPDGWSEWGDLARLCRTHDVDACWLTDQPLIDRRYGALRAAGVSYVAMHARTSGERSVPGALKSVAKRILARRPAWSADRYIAISDFVKRRLLESGLLPPHKVVRIHNAIDVSQWSERAERSTVRAELGLEATTRLVVCACRAQAYKGVDTLIEACARLPHEDPSGAPIVGLHCGAGPDLESFRKRIAGLGLQRRFLLLGRRDRVRELIAAADVVAVPSRWQEGFGLSVVEAMAAQRAVVASHVGAIPELIEHERSGLLVPPGDPPALAAAIRRLLEDPQLASFLGAAAGADALLRFDLPRLRAELVALFLQALELH